MNFGASNVGLLVVLATHLQNVVLATHLQNKDAPFSGQHKSDGFGGEVEWSGIKGPRCDRSDGPLLEKAREGGAPLVLFQC